MQQFANPEDAKVLALAIVDAIPDPLLVLNDACGIIAANRSFAEAFGVGPQKLHDQFLFDLADGRWDIPVIRELLARVFTDQGAVDGFEFEGDLTGSGPRTIILNARLLVFAEQARPMLLLGFKDITARRAGEREKAKLLEKTSELLAQQRILVREIQHRVANSLQIIASILMLKTRRATSREAREHLLDAHERVLSVAQVQSHLSSAVGIDQIDIRAYLSKLCKGLASAMIGPDKPVIVTFFSSSGGTLDSSRAVSIGLIVTELVLNSIKHAFPTAKSEAAITVTYEATDDSWSLAVRDNGLGTSAAAPEPGIGGLGTAIVAALTSQLGADITTVAGAHGREVVIGPKIRATLPLAA
jgi:chemotaxis protein methyltransferase CheR